MCEDECCDVSDVECDEVRCHKLRECKNCHDICVEVEVATVDRENCGWCGPVRHKREHRGGRYSMLYFRKQGLYWYGISEVLATVCKSWVWWY